MSAILLNIQQGDEIIMPSFTFVSTPNSLFERSKNQICRYSPRHSKYRWKIYLEEAITPNSKGHCTCSLLQVSVVEMGTLLGLAKNTLFRSRRIWSRDGGHFLKMKGLGALGGFGPIIFGDKKIFPSGGRRGGFLNHKKEGLFV